MVGRIALIVGALLLHLPLHYAWKLTTGRSPWPRRFLGRVAWIAGMRAQVKGRPLRAHVLFLSNHLSWLDILLLAGASGAVFVSKAEVARWPVVGWLARLHDTIFVQRTERRTVRGQADTLRDALASGTSVALFPEGTTGDGTRLMPFRASLLASLFPSLPGLKVQPVAIHYGTATADIAWGDDEGALSNALRILSRRGVTEVTLQFLPAIDPDTYPDRKVLALAAHRAVAQALGASDSPSHAV